MLKLKIVSVIIIISVIGTVAFAISKMYVFVVVAGLLTVVLCTIWYRTLGETLILHAILKNGHKMNYDMLIDLFGKKAQLIIRRMENKKIITILGTEVQLKNK